MPIRPGQAADLPQIRHLLRGNRSYLNGGLEDLPGLLIRGITIVGESERGDLWGFVAFQIESKLEMPAPPVPDRVSLRAAAVVQRLFGGQRLPTLLEAALVALRAIPNAMEVFALTSYGWLVSALKQVGFEEIDQVRFYVRTQRDVPATAGPAHLRPVQEQDLDPLARLDSETFVPLWHMGRAELLQLCFTARVQVAELQSGLVGYTATAVHARPDDPYSEGEAQIVRLAVHPSMQRRGIGRQLLADSILYAHAQGVYRIQLNTQESNKASQQLYESFNFRRQGRNVPVLVYALPAQTP